MDKSKVSEDKSKALEVVEDDMSKSKDEPTQPATTSTVEEDGACEEDHGPVKHQDAEIKKSCTIDDDNNKSASKKKNNDGKSSDNVSTAKEDEGRSTSKEIVDETQLLMVHPKILLTHLLQRQRRMEMVLT